jgi:hypothetical protein
LKGRQWRHKILTDKAVEGQTSQTGKRSEANSIVFISDLTIVAPPLLPDTYYGKWQFTMPPFPLTTVVFLLAV